MSVKISAFELENVKRVRAVALTPAESGLTVIGGVNGAGKTSVLDAIAWSLGGDKFRPSSAVRFGSVLPPKLCVTLSNGIVVTRSGKNSELKVTDPSGKRAGQALLNSFISAFALDLPRFMAQSERDKADTLLRIIGVDAQLAELDHQEAEAYSERTAVGRIADQKRKAANELPEYPDTPDTPLSASELIAQQQDILARNGENARKREKKAQYEREVGELKEKIRELNEKLRTAEHNLELANADIVDIFDETTAELEENIRHIDEINIRVRANAAKRAAEAEAEKYGAAYDKLTEKIESLRTAKRNLLDGAVLPLEGLSVSGQGALTYRGAAWDCMSGSEQLKVAAAIVRKLNPECGFVLIDKLEQLDKNTLTDFARWCEAEKLQVIATRVSTGEECTIVITDGSAEMTSWNVAESHDKLQSAKQWKEGEF